jgi:hypothetical protein
MRILAFVLALLLLAGTVDPTRGWLITLVVLTGLSAFRPRFGNPLEFRPKLDVRLGAFVFAVLLLAGVMDANRDWLIGLAAVTGVAAFMPGMISLGRGRRRSRWDWEWAWSEPREWRRRRATSPRRDDPWGDDWP